MGMYNVVVGSVDGTHVVVKDVTFKEAEQVILGWLGSYYDKLSDYRYVGMYGDTIEMVQTGWELCCDCGEIIEGEPTEFFGECEDPIHPACKKAFGATLDSETDDEEEEEHCCGCSGNDSADYCDDCLPF